MLSRQNFINMKLGLAAELLGYHLLHIPMLREDLLIIFFIIFQSPFQPREPSPSIFKLRVRLPRLEYFLIRPEYEVRKPHFNIVYCVFSHSVDGKTSLMKQLFMLDSFLNIFELF